MQAQEIHKLQTSPFVEMIVQDHDGMPLFTVCGESEELSKLLNRLGRLQEASGFPIVINPRGTNLGQDVFKVECALARMLVAGFYTKSWKDLTDTLENMDDTYNYAFVVSY
jgi:hypothetical protein